MSVRELKRVEVLGRVKAGEVTLRQASELLAVSYRHAKRLWKRFRRRGHRGLGALSAVRAHRLVALDERMDEHERMQERGGLFEHGLPGAHGA
jgi:molybdenum-dependent DNA-binding transcriptional regulator ModE